MLLFGLILLPLIGGLLCWPSDRLGDKAPRIIALITMGITLLFTLILWGQGDFSVEMPVGHLNWQAEFMVPWIPRLGINFHLAIDGLSMLMVALTALLGVLAVLATWNEQHERIGLFHLAMLWTIAGVIGVFTAIDLFLFFFFWEMMLIPMYFMIALWGHKAVEKTQRFSGATKFLIYTQASGLVLLVSIIGLAVVFYNHTQVWTFDYNELLTLTHLGLLPFWTEFLLMLGFFVAFAVKMPLIPVHGWLADAHEQAPTAGSIDISGLLLKTAAYGMLRFSLPLFPDSSMVFAPVAMGLGIIGLFYGAWLAFAQTDIKRLVAYTSVSHMGLVTIAIYSGSLLAFQGAVVQMVAHGLSAAALFIICGILYQRFGTRDMREMGGLWGRVNYLPAFTLFFAVATLGMPGTGNFVGEFMMLFGTFSVVPVLTSIAAFAMVFASIYSLSMMQRVYYGKVSREEKVMGLSYREIGILTVLTVLLVILGVYPSIVLNTSEQVMAGFDGWLNSTSTLLSDLTQAGL